MTSGVVHGVVSCQASHAREGVSCRCVYPGIAESGDGEAR